MPVVCKNYDVIPENYQVLWMKQKNECHGISQNITNYKNVTDISPYFSVI